MYEKPGQTFVYRIRSTAKLDLTFPKANYSTKLQIQLLGPLFYCFILRNIFSLTNLI